VEGLSREGYDKLARLREAEQEAAEAFCAVLVENYKGAGGSHRRSAG
jgi:predicted lipoprotein